MSDAHDEHESAIKTPKQLIVAVLAGFLVPIIAIVLLVQYVSNDKKVGAGSSALTPEAIATRISPVADQGFNFKDASGPKTLQSGEAVYKTICAACHDTGAASAPKFGNAADWGPRIAQGYDKVLANAIGGLRAMPAKGGNPDLDDIEVARAVVHLANSAGAKFKEPEVKPAAAASAEASAK
ncbi:c-type cytochrome [Undibacterium umbellatum]|uniref:Cytochrome c5 family protein n=1 Tax=Undibacterium umbellatum TaxID=2762300 RepID=A0ABR6ZEU5_9BURK|nr:c-type cytochrome [Undibacterium umbellatum]MBC3910266.1 cytochrome c5 family protein [Undibacterium umbellatum]